MYSQQVLFLVKQFLWNNAMYVPYANKLAILIIGVTSIFSKREIPYVIHDKHIIKLSGHIERGIINMIIIPIISYKKP